MPFSVFFFAVRTGNTGILRPKERQNQAALSLFISVLRVQAFAGTAEPVCLYADLPEAALQTGAVRKSAHLSFVQYACVDVAVVPYRLQCHLILKYNMYGKEHDKKFRKRRFNSYNWEKNEEGYMICPDGRVFDQYERDTYRNTAGGDLTVGQLYYEKDKCEGCPFRNECLQNPNGYRRYTRNVIRDEMWETVNRELSSEAGVQMKIQRSVKVEGAFGVIKQDFGFTRFHRKGMKNVKMNFFLYIRDTI